MRSELVIRLDFGRIVPWVRRVDGALVAIAGPDALCFRTPVETYGENMTTVSNFTVSPGDRVPFVLTWFPSHEQLPDEIDPEQALADTEEYWLSWADGCTHTGDYHDEIHQSLLVLKALTYAPTGGIVAAPTTSLPEHIGGVRNWDYRFCWLRDATLTLLAMLRSGYRDEAIMWRDWLLRAVAGDPADVQIMYGLAGERRLDEYELDWLPGYEGSQPVRVGNAASTQLQLDVYGEVLDAFYQARANGAPPNDAAWSLVRKLLEWLADGWRLEDAGIWEVRGPNRHFTHSKLMAWVAFDRAIRFHEDFDREGPVDLWRALRDEIHAEVLQRGWSEEKQAFTQSYDSTDLDASVLLMPLVGFLPATDPRMVSTVEAIRRELTVEGLILRYRPAGRWRRRTAGRRGRVSPLLVLARQRPRPPGQARRGARALRAPARPAQRSRPALGGVRPAQAPPTRQLPASVHAPLARERRVRARRGPRPSRRLERSPNLRTAPLPVHSRARSPRRAPESGIATGTLGRC